MHKEEKMKKETKDNPDNPNAPNPYLHEAVFKDTQFKELVVDYVGSKSDEEEVTVEMIVETMAEEFPEFLLAIAEENWIRGYKQALDDVERDMDFIATNAPKSVDGKPTDEKVSN